MDPLLVGGLGVAILLHLAVYVLRSLNLDRPRAELADAAPPWDDRPSIFAHVSAHLDPSGVGLTEGGEALPDEARLHGVDGLRWAAGALDGVLGHHAGEEGAALSAMTTRRTVEAIKAVTEVPHTALLKRAYDFAVAEGGAARLDALLSPRSSSSRGPSPGGGASRSSRGWAPRGIRG
jgi:hypothetical protein